MGDAGVAEKWGGKFSANLRRWAERNRNASVLLPHQPLQPNPDDRVGLELESVSVSPLQNRTITGQLRVCGIQRFSYHWQDSIARTSAIP